MDTEGQWSAYRIPGYAGFVPGKKDIYGKSYGKVPVFKDAKEKRNETREITSDEYNTKNTWQVLLPPVRVIPGYTGHLPGKSYVFGKTFTQQVDECFNILATAKKVTDEKRRNFSEMSEMNNSKSLDKRRPTNQIIRPEHPHLSRTTGTPLTKEKSPEFQHRSLQKNGDSAYGQNNSSRLSNNYNRESRTELLNSSKIDNNLNDNKTFEDKEKLRRETTDNGIHEPRSMERNYEYYSKNNVSPEVKTETAYSRNYTREKQYQKVYEHKMRANSIKNGENYYPYKDSPCNGVENRRCSCCRSYKNAFVENNEEKTEQKCNKYGNDESKLSPSQNYYNNNSSNNSRYNFERNFTETAPSNGEANHRRVDNKSKHNVEFSPSVKENENNGSVNEESLHFENPETNWANVERETMLKSSSDVGNIGEELPPTEANGYDHRYYHGPTERGREVYENSNRNHYWQNNRNRKQNFNEKNFGRKEDNANRGTRYFNTSLYPPISGYRGYIPRLNSSSALGIPFGIHIDRNVRN
ncbi:probable serine/threonine-protein kinase clkA [Centruroides sculpturatus]|uniref:probable serine/threonine-protein kinase clkA n=1 Tax=Centruroides sculpturatus TaxID=218467 RepID=UPI000C6E6327|nr:probable serine/threonine-protein kinase clkA [Centruroides sculpturatus]XP_023227809.1 probable serine/threonine-protein kinase clkA [Centruroides sculpturatus]